jgi:putative acetyltransferase
VSSKKPIVAASSYRLVPRGEDLSPLADLWVASWQATLSAIDFSERRAWFLDELENLERQGAVTLCALDAEDNLAGFILLDPARNILEQLCVALVYFGCGVGAFLLNHAKRLCPKRLSLDVNADNPRALRFYEKHGFRRAASGINPHSGLPIWHLRWEA